ncbi:TonB-dependent siderophore receptor [Malaciobacter molluscorum LMG 25693]|uniref:TonB-dependent siderophore receptor n=1 Tax=Malaciobacter molluscorum LMG 25693 TaxID=870501 RepID=A0A2G1DGB4_9BACT|nr:TonB-dependent siderophore receptor [Malaciobacter molluscorum]AXX93459.1 TonB-dependent siderophore receptor [Malaciobacter molluscorum LMG 25693]PHO17527.1 TonB-dependent siderophore receptor [Malaciobacter molluscorum LMG 25693]
MKKRYMFAFLFLLNNATIFAEELDSVLVIGAQESYFEEYSSSSMKGEFKDKETPYSVSVTKGTLIDDLQAQRIEDTYDYTTGVTKVGKNADAIMIRGFQTNLQNIQVNGMSGLISRMGSPSTANVERIEVVKGPASVLYGAMQPSGLINIQTKLPQSKQSFSIDTSFQTYMSNSSKFGEDNGITTTFDSTGPINDDLFYRFIVVGEKIDSYRKDVDFKNLYIYPSLLWNINDNTSLLVAMEYGNEKGSADDGLAAANHNINNVASLETIYQEKNDYDNDKGTAFDVSLDHYINSNLSYKFLWRSVFHEDDRKLYENRKVNNSTNIKDATLTRRNRHQYNERDWHSFDTNLKYNTRFLDMNHNMLFGLSGAYKRTDYVRKVYGGNVKPDLSIYNPILGGNAIDKKGNRRETKSYSAGLYIQDKIDVTDKLILVGSLRVDRTKIDFECLRGNCVDDMNKLSTDYVGSIGAVYNINDIFSIYGSYAQSYDPNSAERVDKTGNSLDSEKSEQFEIGTKINITEKLNTILSFYKIDKENVAESNPGGYYELKGEVESKGFEAEIQWLPTANWQFKTGYAYNETEYISGKDMGNTPKNSPKSTAYLFTRYNIPKKIYDGTLGVTAGVVYRDETYTSSSETTRVELPSYTRYDMGLHYSLKDWELALNVENITDKKYYESGTNDYRIYSGEPRKITFNFKRKF